MGDADHPHEQSQNVDYSASASTGAVSMSAETNLALDGDGSATKVDAASMEHQVSSDPAATAPDGAIVGHGNPVGDNAQVGAYGFANGVNENESRNNENIVKVKHSSENGNGPAEARVVEPQFEEATDVSTEEDRLWTIVKTNSLDFNAWTALIQETEKVAEDNVLKIRRVYDAFLAEFPLCYGYWKKYADHEARLATADKIVEVYERAILGVTYSVDIWLHYCTFAISTYEDPDTIRRLFERGLAYVGTDYLSYPLWDKYIEYEYSQQEWMNLAIIYTRILEHPIQQLDRYFNSFKELAASRPLSEIRTTEEAESMLSADAVNSDRGVDSEGLPVGGEQSHKPASLTETEELEKYIGVREEMFKKAKEYESKIHDFEAAIRRPYFHFRPLEDHQLSNWHNYLDFIEREGDFNKVVKLYERCLVACANYSEYWIRYVLCMETNGSMELAINALARATQVFVKRQPEIHLFAAKFKEHNGDIVGARAEYRLIHSEIAPGLVEAVVKHANMEYRLGQPETAFSVYEEAIATEQGNEQSQMLPVLLVQYSRFLYLVAGNPEKAREVLSGSLDRVPLSKPLLEGIIYLESIQSVPKRIDYLDALVEKFITPNLENPNAANATEREDLSSIFLEFLDLFGDAQAIKKAENRHAKLFSHQKSTSESRKRGADDFLSSDKAKLARTYAGLSTVASPVQSVMGAYPNAQQLVAGYGPQSQGWAHGVQTQTAPQWNTGYAAQAGYAGYGTYGYPNPQPVVSAPQQAAYGAYPPQTYSQPAPAFTPAPQASAAPQAYYGSYY